MSVCDAALQLAVSMCPAAAVMLTYMSTRVMMFPAVTSCWRPGECTLGKSVACLRNAEVALVKDTKHKETCRQ